MKKAIICLLLISTFTFTQNYDYKAKAAQAGAYNKAAVSMAVWGIGLTVGFAIIYTCFKTSTSES